LHRRRDVDAGGLFSDRLAKVVPAGVFSAGGRAGAGGCVHVDRRPAMKIGFLAMSGVRAHDPELLKLGLTLPGFVERSKVIASLPSLGLLYLAASTAAGHELQYYEAESDKCEPKEIYGCDLVAISTFSAQVFEAY